MPPKTPQKKKQIINIYVLENRVETRMMQSRASYVLYGRITGKSNNKVQIVRSNVQVFYTFISLLVFYRHVVYITILS